VIEIILELQNLAAPISDASRQQTAICDTWFQAHKVMALMIG